MGQLAQVGVNVCRNLKLFGRGIIFEVFQFPICVKVIDRQTDGQTDGQTTYCGITALYVASRGKSSN